MTALVLKEWAECGVNTEALGEGTVRGCRDTRTKSGHPWPADGQAQDTGMSCFSLPLRSSVFRSLILAFFSGLLSVWNYFVAVFFVHEVGREQPVYRKEFCWSERSPGAIHQGWKGVPTGEGPDVY